MYYNMAFKSESICSICCETFSKVETNLSHLLHLHKLCSTLRMVTFNGDASTATPNISNSGWGGKINCSPISEVEKLVSVICPGCLVCVSSTLTKREQLNSLEVEVRQLQVKILELLNNLQESVKAFKTEVNIMEGIVKLGRDNVRNLDNFYCSGRMEGGNKRQGLLKDVIQFRENVLTVFQDLCNFADGLQVLSTSDSSTGQSSAEVVNAITLRGRCSRDKRGRAKNPVMMETPVGEEEEMEEEASCMDLDHDDNNYADDASPDQEIVGGSLDNDDDYNEDAHSFNGNIIAQESDDVESNSEGEDDDDEYLPSTSSLKSRRKETERNPTKSGSVHSLLQTLHSSNMTPFKKNLLTRVIKRKEKLQRQNKIKCNIKNRVKTAEELMIEELDPRNFCFISYDPSKTNTLSLRDVIITINEQEGSLQCTKCDFKSYQNKVSARVGHAFELEDTMYNHVVGRHLKLYSCPQCHRDFSQFKTLRNHILSHDNRYGCDVCGKSLSCAMALRQHKWLHMNEQEKAEAEKSGEKPPNETYRRAKETGEKQFQCPTCGKRFLRSSYLKKHEQETHSSNRPHMCSLCGKAFKNRDGLSSHQKFVCYPGKVKRGPPEESKRFRCDQCPKAYYVPNKLRLHKRLAHSSEPPTYKCSICGKMFKMAGSLRIHERIHSDRKPLLCPKGCGATYTSKGGCKRHEKMCGS